MGRDFTAAPHAMRRLVRERLVPRTAVGRQVALVSVLDGVGSGMYLASAAVYFTRGVGLSAEQVGLGLSMAGLAGFAGVVPIGALADRLRPGRVYLAIQVSRGLGYTAYAFVSSFPLFMVAAGWIGLMETSVQPVYQAMVGATVPAGDRVDTLAKARAARNAGYGLGAMVATAALYHPARGPLAALILANAASFFVGAVLLHRAGVAGAGGGMRAPGRFALVDDARYLAIALLNGVLSIHMTLLAVGLPLWIAGHTRLPVAIIGVLIMINTAMIVVMQTGLAQSVTAVSSAAARLGLAGLALAACGVLALLLGAAGNLLTAAALALGAVVAITLAEMLQTAGAWVVSYELAPSDRRARYLATFQLGTSLQSILGPGLITGVVFRYRAGWTGFAAASLLAGLLVVLAAGQSGGRAEPP